MLAVFLALCAVVVGIYAGYPAAVFLFARLSPRSPTPEEPSEAAWPRVCLTIPVHDEQAIIEAKLRNFIALYYPPDRLRAVVISDASTDLTCQRIRSLLAELGERERSRITLIERSQRTGKSRALSEENPNLDADILVFTDANAFYRPDAVKQLVRPFADPRVGLACGRLRYVPDEGFMSDEELYWRYEDLIKEAEGRAGRLLVANGSIYALRAALFQPIPGEVADDFAMPLLVAARGHRLVYAHDAVAEERLPAQGIENFRAKARIVTRGASALRIYWREVLRAGPVRVLQYLLHKVARWLMGFVLAALLAVSAIGASHPILAAALTAQVAFYLLGIAAYLLARRGPVPGLLRMPFYFLLVNAAALAGLADFARGRRRATWEKSETTRRAPDEEVAVAEHAAHEVPAGRHFSRRTALLVAAVLATAALLAAETGARLTYAARDALRAMNLVAVRNAPRQVYVLPLPTDDRRLLPDSAFRVAELARPRPDTRRPSLAERARSAGIGEDEVALRINAEGYKGPPLDPEHRLPRLLALGDSCTFGSLLDRLSYPRALERELAALGMPVEVVNAGVPSAEPRHLVARLDEFRALRPDAAVLCMGWDALYAQRYTPTTWLDQLYILRGVRALWGRWREHSPDTGEVPPRLPDRPLRPDPHDPEIQRLGRYEPPFLDDVKRLAEGLRAAEIPVFVLTVPTLYVSGERPTEQALELGVLPRFTDNPYVLAALASRYNQRLRELADGSGLELIDVAAWGREALKPRHRYFASPSALNEEGQQRMGALVAQRVHASLGATRR